MVQFSFPHTHTKPPKVERPIWLRRQFLSGSCTSFRPGEKSKTSIKMTWQRKRTAVTLPRLHFLFNFGQFVRPNWGLKLGAKPLKKPKGRGMPVLPLGLSKWMSINLQHIFWHPPCLRTLWSRIMKTGSQWVLWAGQCICIFGSLAFLQDRNNWTSR